MGGTIICTLGTSHFTYFTQPGALYTITVECIFFFFVTQGSLYRVDDRKKKKIGKECWVGGRQNGEMHFKYPHPEDH